MEAVIRNPYVGAEGVWLRGSFHGHTSEHSGCAEVPLAASLSRYRELGADFVACTDHDHVTDLADARAGNPDLVLISGFEYSRAENLLFLGEQVPPLHEQDQGAAMSRAAELLTIVAHPCPRRGETYWSRALLESLPRLPDGVEVYNGHYGIPRKVAKGSVPLYDGFWDELLSAGHFLWGFANDDSHHPEDFGNAWNMVASATRSAGGILGAARAGRSYATTGLLASEIHARGTQLEVGFDRPVDGRFVGPGGHVLSQARGARFRHTLGAESYARFEAVAGAGRIWLQPVCRRVLPHPRPRR